MIPAIAVLFALGFYAVTVGAVRRTRRLIGGGPIVFAPSGGLEMKIAAALMLVFPAALVASTLLPGVRWFRPVIQSPALPALAAVLFAGGLLLQRAAIWTLGPAFRIGIDPDAPGPLVREGPYRYLRHPIYASFIAYYVAAWLLQPNLLFGVVTPLAVLRIHYQATLEERLLLARHGAAYAAYARTTSRFIPFVW
ncbi:MAG: isoprenylcysteine carboxylmethyltransferase family protein [Armatimonadota bacterium]|nr:isoprenylcysteine carboxylmethyltransferase family protein [Armatimonadota bacterium]MDR7451722.1 isoprenylcysteine carboxylmethyltransferase family protein [Armatimonadota bacterium]MDR7465660.1 isoprenylcysteine carboxylmethyltransferase family protein [Armatimonadota bacterium]MDR7493569.1 isoprenylcysteine carboxylmethyltransferase family protein [Armatimonadota bacterium]MDR7499527.1 isoprenylcysteine carboxylmethyltransferase family protein [Armatimonadota bacterium]